MELSYAETALILLLRHHRISVDRVIEALGQQQEDTEAKDVALPPFNDRALLIHDQHLKGMKLYGTGCAVCGHQDFYQ